MKIFVGAGEASGDRILAALLRGLRARRPDLELRGFGGPLCAAEGLRSLVPARDLAVNGAGDVLRRGLSLVRICASLRRELEAFRPDRVLLVDYPGMNVALARRAIALGIPVHYVAPPQLWAYRDPSVRLRRLRAALDGASLQMLFPFEAPHYESRAPWTAGLCQGHFFPAPAPFSPSPPRGDRLLLCPGSRLGVLRRNLPLWLARLRAAGWGLSCVDVLVPEYLEDDARTIIAAMAAGGITVVTDPAVAFARARTAIAFPGTITLELFLHRIPTRVWGVLDPLTLRIGRLTLRGPHIALPNVLAEHGVFPEWTGTARAFRAAPPDLPEEAGGIDGWSPVADDTVRAVWERMGSDQGVARGVAACLEGDGIEGIAYSHAGLESNQGPAV